MMQRRIIKTNNRKGKWILTFNDMVTLLLTFFVLILSMSHVDAVRLREMSSSVRNVIGANELPGKERAGLGSFYPVVESFKDIDIERARELRADVSHSIRILDRREIMKLSLRRLIGTDLHYLSKGISISLGEKLLFTPGSDVINEEALPLLKNLGQILRENDVTVSVEGHTDNLPITTDRFPSNWELSIARAVSVVKYLISSGGVSPERLSVAGYADTRPKAMNINSENRDLNRRVEIFIRYS